MKQRNEKCCQRSNVAAVKCPATRRRKPFNMQSTLEYNATMTRLKISLDQAKNAVFLVKELNSKWVRMTVIFS